MFSSGSEVAGGAEDGAEVFRSSSDVPVLLLFSGFFQREEMCVFLRAVSDSDCLLRP